MGAFSHTDDRVDWQYWGNATSSINQQNSTQYSILYVYYSYCSCYSFLFLWYINWFFTEFVYALRVHISTDAEWKMRASMHRWWFNWFAVCHSRHSFRCFHSLCMQFQDSMHLLSLSVYILSLERRCKNESEERKSLREQSITEHFNLVISSFDVRQRENYDYCAHTVFYLLLSLNFKWFFFFKYHKGE